MADDFFFLLSVTDSTETNLWSFQVFSHSLSLSYSFYELLPYSMFQFPLRKSSKKKVFPSFFLQTAGIASIVSTQKRVFCSRFICKLRRKVCLTQC